MLKLTVFTPERKLLDKVEVEWVMLPGYEGQIQILEGHAAMSGLLMAGGFAYGGAQSTSSGAGATASAGHKARDSGFISTGFFEVANDELTVMAEVLELREEIDVDRAKKAQTKAAELLENVKRSEDILNVDDADYMTKYSRKMERALLRQAAASGEFDH